MVNMMTSDHIQAVSEYLKLNYKPTNGVFDITELGSELLVNYLARTSEPNEVSLSSSNLTDAIQQSFLVLQQNYSLDNDWDISIRVPFINKQTNSIYLPVVLSTNRILELQQAIKDNEFHPLIVELSLIACCNTEVYDIKPKLFIIAVDRLHTDYKPMPTKAWNIIELKNPMTIDELTKLLTSKTNKLQKHLVDRIEPSKCENIRWHKKSGKSINITCQRCNYSTACKHFSNYMNSKRITNDLIF